MPCHTVYFVPFITDPVSGESMDGDPIYFLSFGDRLEAVNARETLRATRLFDHGFFEIETSGSDYPRSNPGEG